MLSYPPPCFRLAPAPALGDVRDATTRFVHIVHIRLPTVHARDFEQRPRRKVDARLELPLGGTRLFRHGQLRGFPFLDPVPGNLKTLRCLTKIRHKFTSG
ncbi:hypothetical protein KM043_007036 [Ampulex compressa]|nr:hypothetical protein KM043_007036 [Ampulex compressa]